jgi:hypothetical protein
MEIFDFSNKFPLDTFKFTPADRLSLHSDEDQNSWIFTSNPPYTFVAGYSTGNSYILIQNYVWMF